MQQKYELTSKNASKMQKYELTNKNDQQCIKNMS